ncbi:hypothetical protein LQ772_15855 [Frateuria edaphi]|uniref:hypothetical protein n=1 Tax=Frateuria edaphi TaxID=2898793 RepID=UPI001E309FB9|nr:hypothetical protein [Frateuria edaphi]UGB45432.1 hypothetical protein LQ772_15855 [Frateuria edaphi]
MNTYLKAAVDGSLQGIRETPRLYFAPVTTLLAWMYQVTESVRLKHHHAQSSHDDLPMASHQS